MTVAPTAPPTDDRQWHDRHTLMAQDDGLTESWMSRCYPLGWQVGLVCDVDLATFAYSARWRSARASANTTGRGESLDDAKLSACEAAETLLAEALDELEKQNIERRVAVGKRAAR
jgi:hypothetical protein